MRLVVGIAIGVAAGFAVASRLRPANTSDCCRRVAAGVRTEVTEGIADWLAGKTGSKPLGAAGGEIVGELGDALGAWRHSPGLLDVLNIEA